jgi:adenosylmethionine-8-amino-7-oxononanoate aminotransferase
MATITPHSNAAIRRQLSRVAHTSFLGFTNPAAIELADAIVALFPDTPLTKVFSPMMAQPELKWP